MKKNITALLCGILFGIGLTIANMINPTKIQNFLDVTGHWDPSLLLVLMPAVVITFFGYRYVLRCNKPTFATTFDLPTKKNIDPPLILGALLFGIGWGLSGYCPGPAFTALGLGIMDPVYFLLGMILGQLVWFCYKIFNHRKN